MAKKQKVLRTHDIKYSLYGLTIDEAVEALKQLKAVVPPEATIEVSSHIEYDVSYATVQLEWYEEETDKEYAERMARIAKAEEWQRKQYEELKKKFEGAK